MEDDHKSRTRKKKQDRALQALGEELVALSSQQLEQIPMQERLHEAVLTARKTKSHGARRRQMQYIGRLMRDVAPAPIENALKNIRIGDSRKALAFKKVEKWRDEIRDGNPRILEEILRTCPHAERQRLTQLARNARNRRDGERGAKSSKILFRYLKEISCL